VFLRLGWVRRSEAYSAGRCCADSAVHPARSRTARLAADVSDVPTVLVARTDDALGEPWTSDVDRSENREIF